MGSRLKFRRWSEQAGRRLRDAAFYGIMLFMTRPGLLALMALVLLAVPMTGASTAATITRTDDDFGPVLMSYTDLQALLQTAHHQIRILNTGSKSILNYESLKITKGRDTVDFDNLGPEIDLKGAPDEATEVRYLYHNQGAPLSNVDINLNDYHRRISVSGETDAVHTTWTVLKSTLSEHQTWGRGGRWRFIFFVPFLSLGIVLLVLGTQSDIFGFSIRKRIALQYSALPLLVLWFIVPDDFLSGTLILWGPTSFWQRNMTTIAVIGTLASVIGIIPLTVLVTRKVLLRSKPQKP